jgi:gliding motility-associated-like protein
MKDYPVRNVVALYLILLTCIKPAGAQTAGFTVPSPVCSGQPVNITNTSVGGSNFYWNFCPTPIDINPLAVNLGNPGGLLSIPTYIKCVNDGGNYYAFLPNHLTGNLIRLSFGNSLLNTPTAYNLGRISGVLPLSHEGLAIVNDGGNWYGFSVGGDGIGTNTPSIVRIDFGPSLANNSPTAVSLGNPGNTLAFPTDIKILKEGNTWLAFIACIQANGPNAGTGANMITRVNFGTSLTNNTPTATNLGNLGNIAYPTGICEVKENGNWYMLVCNVDNHSITRLDFGNSLLNTPSGTNLGNPGGLLNAPRDMQFLRTCNGLYGYVINAHGSPNNVIRLEFGGGSITGPLTATNLGGMGGLAGVHPMSDFFRIGDTLYSFVPNVTGNTLTRIALPSCTTSGIPSSSSTTPPPVTFPLPNTTYPINLLMDEGLPTQTAYCASVSTLTPVIDSVTALDPTICGGANGALMLHTNMANTTGSITYLENGVPQQRQPVTTDGSGNVTLSGLGSGTYSNIQFQHTGCGTSPVGPYVLTGPASVQFVIDANPSDRACVGDTVVLTSSPSFGSASYLWSTGTSQPSLRVTRSDTYWLEITDGQCSGRDSIVVVFSQAPQIHIGNDTTICEGDSFEIGDIVADATYLWSTGSTNPLITVSDAGTYVLAADRNGCVATDTITISVSPLPGIDLGPDGDICPNQTIVLDASWPDSRYLWSTGDTTATLSVTEAGSYSITVTSAFGCKQQDAVSFSYYPLPVVSLGPDTTVCEETPLILRPFQAHADALRWSDGSTDVTLAVAEGGVYTVSGINKCGEVQDTVVVQQIFCDIWVPNAFTPNGDGVNDMFRALGNIGRLQNYSFQIFNRWGQRVFSTTDPTKGWDGRQDGGEAPGGVYVYSLEYSVNGKPVIGKGNFTLLR